MRRLIGLVVLLILMLPAVAGAQQIGGTAPSSLLQSSGAGLQQGPGGLQGSVPQIFGDSNNGGILNQSDQKLLDGIGPSSKSDNQKQAEVKSVNDHSKTFLASLCLVLAGAAFLLWARLRQFS